MIIEKLNKKLNEYLNHDLSMAKQFLSCLDENDDRFTFQTFSDSNKVTDYSLVGIYHGTLEENADKLIKVNQSGAGIFVTVNKTDLKGRKKENITNVRAVFVDLDGAPLAPIYKAPLSPHVIVETSKGKYHIYWIVEGLKAEQFSKVQKKLIEMFGGDPQVHDLSRVMRLPGFYHNKQEPFLAKIIESSQEPPFSSEKFFQMFNISFLEEKNVSSNSVLDALRENNMLIKQQAHPTGCWSIECPWSNQHSNGDLGAKYYEPNTNGYEMHGFKCFHAHCSDKTIYNLMSFLELDSESIDPLPLYRPIEAPKPFPMHALGDILGPAAETLAAVIKAPDAICAQSVLGAASLATQAHANILIDGRMIPLSLYLITVAESGDRKSSTDKIALKPIYEWQKLQHNIYQREIVKYQLAKEAWEFRRKEFLKANNHGDNSFDEQPPIPPLRPMIITEEPTYEGIVRYFSENGQPSVGLFSDEGARFLGGHAMNSDNRIKTIAGLSSLWDGKEITRLRSGDGDMLIYGKRFSMHLMMQENILTELVKNPLFNEQGFLPRCLISFPSSTVGQRPYSEKDPTAFPQIKDYFDRLNSTLDSPFPVITSDFSENELNPRSLSLSKDAKVSWIAFHDQIDENSARGKPYYEIRRFANKAAEQVLRISAILRLVSNQDATEIELQDIQNGTILLEYYLEECLRISGISNLDQNLVCATELLKWFWEQGYTKIALRTIYQYGPVSLGIRKASTARYMMKILESHGWAVPIPNSIVDGKQCKEAWLIRNNQE